jgi:hypothetical protein
MPRIYSAAVAMNALLPSVVDAVLMQRVQTVRARAATRD